VAGPGGSQAGATGAGGGRGQLAIFPL